MLKLFAFIILLILIYSCNYPNQQDKRYGFDNSLLIGEWRLDSSSNRFFSSDRLIIVEDSSLYLFSGSDGGSLLTKGRRFGKDSVNTTVYGNTEIYLIDSNHLQFGSTYWIDTKNFYERTNYGDYHDDLKEYLQQDSLRKKLIGWWKLTSSQMPVKLSNYRGYYDKFTLNIRNDGKAAFYLENKFDSTVTYFYRVNSNSIALQYGDVISDCHVSFDSKERMKLVLDRRTGDTLLLERITDIK